MVFVMQESGHCGSTTVSGEHALRLPVEVKHLSRHSNSVPNMQPLRFVCCNDKDISAHQWLSLVLRR